MGMNYVFWATLMAFEDILMYNVKKREVVLRKSLGFHSFTLARLLSLQSSEFCKTDLVTSIFLYNSGKWGSQKVLRPSSYFPIITQVPKYKLTLHNFIVRTKQILDKCSAIELIKEQNFNYSKCSINNITPHPVPVVLESYIKLSENFVTVCVFVPKMGDNVKKRLREKGRRQG